MGGAIKLLGVVVATTFFLVLFTDYRAGTLQSVTTVGGLPVISIQQIGARGIIAISQVDARGVLAFGQVAFGIVTIGQSGVGLLFFVGQVGAGFLVVGQLAIGLVMALGQGALAPRRLSQGSVSARTRDWFSGLNDELGDLLRPPRFR